MSVSTSVQDARDIDRMVKVLIARATAVYEKKCTAATPDGTGGLTKIYDGLSASDTALLCPPKMLAASSRRHTLSYFRSFCMKVDALGIAICQENAGQIAKLIRDMTESIKKSRGTTVTETTILQHIRAVEWQLDRLTEIRPDAPIKPLILPRDRAKSVAPEAEQQKYIGEAATVLTVATLRRLAGNGLSLGGILMLLGMARTAEACAPKFGEIVLRDDYAVIAIVWQADGTTRIADLKTDNSYRLIILPKIAAEAIRARMAYLRELGYTEEQIRDMPAVSAERDPTTQASPAALRAFLLSIHYYDEIGLLPPSEVTSSGYRVYNDADLEVLQQILFFRELDFSLEEIRGIMQNPAYEKETALQNQKALLVQKRDRLDRLIALVDKTLKGERDMSFKQFDTTKIEEAKQQYAAEVKQRWGNTVAYAEYEKKSASYNILMPVSTATAKMLYRNLLYTAISRARKEVILVGSREAVNTAMQCIPYPRKSKLVARTNLLRLRRSA